jgi:uncharacterized protein
LPAQSAQAAPTELFFSEYIEGSSNNKALEIYNGTGAAVDLLANGYSVQMFFNGSATAGLTINLTGSVADGDVYVVAQATASAPILAQADQTNGAGWFNGDDAVVLRKGTTIIDVIGQLGVDPGTEWGSGLTSTADNTLRRKLTIEAGDTNGSDTFDPSVEWDGFATDTFDGLGCHSADCPPAVANTVPANGAINVFTGSNININFNEAVTVTGSWFSISCGSSGSHTATVSGGPQNYTLNPDTDFAFSESCTVTVFASNVADQDGTPDNMAANYTWSFTTETPPPPAVPIHDIQGSSHRSTLTSTGNTPGIVTAKTTNGFWMEAPQAEWDTNDATSEGIFVFTSSAPTVNVGDAVRVSGNISEFRPGGVSSTNLTTTEITSPSIAVLSSGNPLPAPVIIGTGGRVPPAMVIEDDATGDVETSGVFDPAMDGIDFYESLEAMHIQVTDAVAVGPRNDFGEIPIVGDDGANAGVRTARGGVIIQPGDFNPERIHLDDQLASTPAVDVGDHFSAPIVGVMDYSFGNFKLLLTSSPTAVSGGLAHETTANPDAHRLSAAAFNVENLDPNDPQSKFDELADLIVDNLKSPDVIAVEEIQDNNGPTNDTVVDASATYNKLIAAIQAAGGPTYDFRNINPVDDQDGGEPGGNIRVGFLFRTDRGLVFVDRPGATPTTANSVTGSGASTQLQYSPGRIDPTNPAFNASRKPLAGEFTFHGDKVFIIANHFNSKGGDQPLFGRFQPPTLTTEAQRLQQAQIVNNFVDSILAADPNANVIVLGDFNDFEFSAPLAALKGNELNDLIETLPQNERYTYVFEGNSQTLDHTLISDSTFNRPFAYDVVHVNSEFADQASDHEPQVARLCVDATAPSLNVTVSPNTLWPPNHKYVTVNATVSVSDNADPGITFSFVSVTSNEPDNAPGPDDGNTTNDIVIVDNDTFRLRAERSDTGTGRIYTITYQATDACGNATIQSATVTVPLVLGD